MESLKAKYKVTTSLLFNKVKKKKKKNATESRDILDFLT